MATGTVMLGAVLTVRLGAVLLGAVLTVMLGAVRLGAVLTVMLGAVRLGMVIPGARLGVAVEVVGDLAMPRLREGDRGDLAAKTPEVPEVAQSNPGTQPRLATIP